MHKCMHISRLSIPIRRDKRKDQGVSKKHFKHKENHFSKPFVSAVINDNFVKLANVGVVVITECPTREGG